MKRGFLDWQWGCHPVDVGAWRLDANFDSDAIAVVNFWPLLSDRSAAVEAMSQNLDTHGASRVIQIEGISSEAWIAELVGFVWLEALNVSYRAFQLDQLHVDGSGILEDFPNGHDFRTGYNSNQ